MARFKARITLTNGDIVHCSGKNMSDAFNNLLMRFTDGFPPSPKRDTISVSAYGNKWYELYHRPKVGYNTAQNARIILDKHIYPYIGNMMLHEVTHDDIQNIFTQMSDYAASTVDKVKIILNQLFSNALEDGIISCNIMLSKRYILSTKVTERLPLSPEQARQIIEQSVNLEELDRTLLLLFMYTGMRRGEALALIWDDVDFENKVIHISKSVDFKTNRPTIKPPKSKAGIRDVPLADHLSKTLMQRESKQGYVITNPRDSTIPLTEVGYRRMWERIGKRINLFGATAHVLRHTFDTLIQPHTDIKTLQTIMGHADISTTMNRYAHPINANIQALASLDVFAAQNAADKVT